MKSSGNGLSEATEVFCAPPFRGEIWEYVKDVPMERSYANGGRPFDIETALYLKPVFEALRNPDIPIVSCLAAVQTLKTFAAMDAYVAYILEHDQGDTTIYIGGDDAASDQARSRALPYWESFPGIAKQLEAAKESNRFNVNTQEFYLPGMVLRIRGLNINTTQRITLRRVIISDAFLSKNTGLVAQAVRRTTQHLKDRKIVVESQGGELGDDMDIFHRTTNQQTLHVTCPLCGGSQPFDFSVRRVDGFVALPPKTIPSLDHAAWVAHNTPLLLADDKRWAGFNRGDDAIIKRKDGTYDEAAVMRETHYLCYHCGGRWEDKPETRYALDKSSHYVATNPNALPGYVGFSWPAWCGQRLKWGGEQVMLGYLRAKQIHERIGRVEELKQWYNKSAAKVWDEKLISVLRQRNQNSYDVAMAKHDAWRFMMLIDNQLDLMTQWVMILAVKKDGSTRQVWRGSLHGLDECRKKQLEYISDTGKPLIPDQFTFLDGRYRPENIVRHIFEKQYGHWANYNGERTWMAWNLLQGSKYEYFMHADVKDKNQKFIVGDPNFREGRIGEYYAEVLVFPFSRTSCGQRFELNRDGNGVETLFLPQQDGEPPDDHELSHHSQIHSNKLVASESFAPREARLRYVPVPKSAPEHYFDCYLMSEAVKEIWGCDGYYGDDVNKIVAPSSLKNDL